MYVLNNSIKFEGLFWSLGKPIFRVYLFCALISQTMAEFPVTHTCLLNKIKLKVIH